MPDKQETISINGLILLFLVLINAIIIEAAYTGDQKWYKFLIVTLPLLLLVIADSRQLKNRERKASKKPVLKDESTQATT